MRYNSENTSPVREDLSALPFDERMKLYKEKYGASAAQKTPMKGKKPAEGKKPDTVSKKANPNGAKKSYNKNQNKNGRPVSRQQAKTEVKTVEVKKGLFSKLASIFKKK